MAERVRFGRGAPGGWPVAVAVRDVAATPVVEGDGSLNKQTATLKVKYKEFLDDAE